mmetsp:Transcript_32942/g.65252  ORF Transcript_32942/g.65252 Transcript_32942/m.65252 type:complete len:81 (-) Transcript_32942:24-266(-)
MTFALSDDRDLGLHKHALFDARNALLSATVGDSEKCCLMLFVLFMLQEARRAPKEKNEKQTIINYTFYVRRSKKGTEREE